MKKEKSLMRQFVRGFLAAILLILQIIIFCGWVFDIGSDSSPFAKPDDFVHKFNEVCKYIFNGEIIVAVVALIWVLSQIEAKKNKQS